MSEVREPTRRPPGPRRLTVWVDEQISPAIASWLRAEFGADAQSTWALGLTRTPDASLFAAAHDAGIDILLTKDADFEAIAARLGPPPMVVLLACGNTSNERLREVLARAWPGVISHQRRGEPLMRLEVA